MAAAFALVGVRSELANTNVALVIVLFVLAGGVIGGRLAGAVSGLVAAAAFDFLFTRPYLTLKIAERDDVVTTLLLVVVGLVAGEVATRTHQLRDRARDDRAEIRRLHRVAEFAAAGEDADDLALIVAAELTETLKLRDCWFERAPYLASFPVLGRNGTVLTTTHRFTREGFELPRDGVELPVIAGAGVAGRFVLMPTPGEGVSPERRLIAVALADQLGVALARPAA